jgi:hypothetical protein
MLHIPKSIKLQCAADDAHSIAECIETLGLMLDRFYETHGDALGARLVALIPGHQDLCPTTSKAVSAFARSLEPPDGE